MPGLTLFVVAGGDTRAASSTVRAARAFFKGVDVEEITRGIHPALGPVPDGAVPLGTSFGDVWSGACSEASSEWVLFLQPGDRISGDLEAVGRLMADPAIDAVEATFEHPPPVPNPAIWPAARLVRAATWTTGANERHTVRGPLRIRSGDVLADPLSRTWALGAFDPATTSIETACVLHHAGFHDAALVRLLHLARASTDRREIATASRYATMVAMAARRPGVAKRPAEDWLLGSGRSQPALVWSAFVELGRDHPGQAWMALREAAAQRPDPSSGIDPAVLGALSHGLEGMIAVRQTEALKYREVLRTAGDDRRRRAAQSLAHAWVGSGLEPARLFNDLDPDGLAAMGEALGSVPALDVDIWLDTVEAYLEHATLSDRLAGRITTTAAIRGIDAARTWSTRLRSVGLAQFCPLLEIARMHSDPVDRAVAAAIALHDFGDAGATPLLRAAAQAVPTHRLPAMLAALQDRVPAALEAAREAAATTNRRRSLVSAGSQ
jgi:hypothetical protein